MLTRPIPGLGAALEWAGALAIRHEHLDYAGLKEAWQGENGQTHRALLRQHSPDLLDQLTKHMAARKAALDQGKAA